MTIGSIFRPILELCREANADVSDVLRQDGLTEKSLVDPETRLPTERSRALAKRIFAVLGDPEVGLHAAERFRLEDADLIGYLARHSESPLDALEALPKYARLIGDAALCRVTVAEGRVELCAGLTGGREPLPEAIDFWTAVIVRAMRAITGYRVRLLEVRLARPRPRRTAGYRQAFGAPVTFDAEESALVFGEAELREPFHDSDPSLRRILERRADDVLGALPEAATLEAQVRAAIRRRLTHDPLGLESIALDLGMSERTLRRRLRESGHTYRALLDAVRAERAVALADERRHSVAAIAELVGFADPTAFARAFRRWTGSAPHEYLRRSQAN